MNKEQWEMLYETLNNAYNDFRFAYHDYNNGKNKKLRAEGERKVLNAIGTVKYHIDASWEVYELLTGGKEVSDFSRKVIYDEFVLPRYFRNDMSEFLTSIKVKINTFN